ncbi:MAG: response regulator [Kofleriaceae bacterium]|nr:response regulator [Kofleriaceae bacterium]
MLATVQGALVQLVRNAVAHGVELPAERRAAGKPEEARVELEVARRGRSVSFSCRDDGRGIDVEAVRRLAVQRGLAGAAASADELTRVLLGGGISTSPQVTRVSGRGVGLDVVREASERLGGEVRVHTDAGRGTRFELVVPATLSSIEAIAIDVGGSVARVPLDAVRTTRRITEGDIARTAHGETIEVDGALIPLLRLHPVLRAAHSEERAAWAAIVVEAGGVRAAVAGDRIAGTSTIVVRPIPHVADVDPIVAGAVLDANGAAHVVLDPDQLVAAALRQGPVAPRPTPARRPVLVIDDSLTTRMLEQSILESAGYEVDTAISGEQALGLVRDKKYALILCDVEMPGIDGFTFIERIRADPALRDIPAILVTSRASAEDIARGEQVGAQGYIVKNQFDQTDLLARIARLTGVR